MNGTTGEQRRPGVYGVDGDGREQQVHPYQGGPYTLFGCHAGGPVPVI